MPILLTEITSASNNLSKVYIFSDNGVTEIAAPTITEGTTKTISLLEDEVSGYLDSLTNQPNKCITLGICKEHPTAELTTVANLQPGKIARSKEFFDFANSGSVSLLLLDFDSSASSKEREDFLSALDKVLRDSLRGENNTERTRICRWSRGSSSSSVKIDGAVKNGLHIFIPVRHCNDQLIKLIHKYCWLYHSGSHIVRDSGIVISSSLIDPAVGSGERVVYTSDATVEGDGFWEKIERKCSYTPGGVIDAEVACEILKELTLDYEKKWTEYRREVEKSPERIRIRNAWKEEFAKKHGGGKQGKKIAALIADFKLTSDMALHKTDGTTVLCKEILLDPDKFLGTTGFNDPIKMNPHRNVGMIIGSDKKQWLKSFNHGEVRYSILWNYDDLKEWCESASMEDLGELLPIFLNSVDASDVALSQLTKEFAKKLGVSSAVVTKASKKAEEPEDLGVFVEADATHRDIADDFINRLGDVRAFGNLYVWEPGSTIWKTLSKSTIEKKLGIDYGNTQLCKVTSHYRGISSLIMQEESIMVDSWSEKIGFPCATGFYTVTKDGFQKHPYERDMLCRFKMRIDPDESGRPMPNMNKVILNTENGAGNDLLFQQLCGLALCGMLPKIQKIAVFFGQGGTGKGTVSDVLKAMLPSSRLTNLYLDQLVDPAYACKLADSRINFTGEVDKRKKTSMKALFAMSGGGTVAARDLYKSSIEFKNNCGFIISSNNFFPLDSVGSETERRFADTIVEFYKRNDSQDDDLAARIIDRELGLVLTWCMKGVQLYLQHGLVTGHSRELYSKWTSGVDPVALFVEEHLRFTGPRDWFLKADAWKTFQKFCEESGYRGGTKGEFYSELLKYQKLTSIRNDGKDKIKGGLLC